MRPSKKTQVLDAAAELIERENLEAVTYEALAGASGMSKSGIIYHFPAHREALTNQILQVLE